MRASDGLTACAIAVVVVLIGQHVAGLRRAPERATMEASRGDVDAGTGAETAELENEPAAAPPAGEAGTRGAFARTQVAVGEWTPGARPVGPEIAETGGNVTWIP
jgi:hypothetical protein